MTTTKNPLPEEFAERDGKPPLWMLLFRPPSEDCPDGIPGQVIKPQELTELLADPEIEFLEKPPGILDEVHAKQVLVYFITAASAFVPMANVSTPGDMEAERKSAD